jgi:hypothetical protein
MTTTTGAITDQNSIESLAQFQKTPRGRHERWQTEFAAAEKAFKDFLKKGQKTVQKYRNDKDRKEDDDTFKLNLFASNIDTLQDIMFGQLPEVKFSRTNLDFNDDVARVALMMFERMLNADIGTPNDQYSEALKNALEDRLLPGLGLGRVRYDFDESEQPVAPVFSPTGEELQPARTETIITNERAPIEYVHWRDVRWSPARTWAEVTWIAFRTRMTREQLVARFGEKVGNKIQLNESQYGTQDSDDEETKEADDEKQDAHQRAAVWEIWDKETREVDWYNADYDKLLDTQDDPLELTGFFPCPEPMVAHATTTAYMPIPDYVYAQDLYNGIDVLEERINKITEAIKVIGVYDQSAEGIKRMFEEAVENELIPVDNWAMFAEKGGIAGQIDWLPVLEVASTLEKLMERRNDLQALLMQITGMADIMQGGRQAGGNISATERALEARFGSIRIQSLQDAFAKFATDLIRLRAEVVSKHFQPESIILQSNATYLSDNDKQLIQPAIALMKDTSDLVWRIQVKPESVAMVDYAQLKQERTEYINGVAVFMQSAAPLVEQDPNAVPVLLELLKWGMAGFKGSNEVEGILDQAIAQMQNPPPQQGNQPPSPEQIKAEQERAKQQFELQKMDKTVQLEQLKHKNEREIAQMAHQHRLQEIKAETGAKLSEEAAQAQLNMEEETHETKEAIKRETAKAALTPNKQEVTTND